MQPLRRNKYGWRPDLPDKRDFKINSLVSPLSIPVQADLRTTGFMPPVWSQELGDCTAYGTNAHFIYVMAKSGMPIFDPSEIFTYYNTRFLEGTVGYDSGASIRNAIKAIAEYGVCNSTLWPNDSSKFTDVPSKDAFNFAIKERALVYSSVPSDIQSIKSVIASGLPVVFGFTVYSSFEGQNIAETGIMPMPNFTYETVMGGHCVLACGYDDTQQRLLCRNSWGENWGDKGYFWMPYSYIGNSYLASDFWQIEKVS